MTFAWHHPNYYKKLKREATSSKPQAASGYDGDIGPTTYLESYQNYMKVLKRQAASRKLQATSSKPKRSVQKIPEPRSTNQQ